MYGKKEGKKRNCHASLKKDCEPGLRPRQKKWAGLKKMTGTQHKNKTAAVFYINFLLSNETYIDLSLSMPI